MSRSRGARSTPSKRSVLTAEWLEYVVLTPGHGEEKVIQRQIFDLLKQRADVYDPNLQTHPKPHLSRSAKLDRALALPTEREFLLQPCGYAADFLHFLRCDALLSNRELLTKILGRFYAANPESRLASYTPKRFPALSLLSFAVGRRRWRTTEEVFVSQVNVVTLHRYLSRNDHGAIGACNTLDIVNNSLSITPRASTSGFGALLAQGVLDTHAENAVLPRGCSLAEPSGSNTVAAFAAHGTSGHPWIAVAHSEDSRLQRLPEPTHRRVAEALRSGSIVVLSPNARSVTWWQINKLTGETLGIGRNGWGASHEYVMSVSINVIAFVMAAFCFVTEFAEGAKESGKDFRKLSGEDRVATLDSISHQGTTAAMCAIALVACGAGLAAGAFGGPVGVALAYGLACSGISAATTVYDYDWSALFDASE